METNEIKALVLKYNEGVADPVEIRQLEKLIEDGIVLLSELRDLHHLDEMLAAEEAPAPSMSLDDRFYKMLADHKQPERSSFRFSWPDWNIFLPRLAFAVVLLAVGAAGGLFLRKPADPGAEVTALSREVGDLKEMMMLSLLEKESASERLRAVSLTSDMDQASHKVTSALLQTLNSDMNVNVRLAALDALRGYARDNTVRAALVKSISLQDSPLVQVALAELMRDLQEKRSVREFDRILNGDKTPQEVKNRIKEKIQILI